MNVDSRFVAESKAIGVIGGWYSLCSAREHDTRRSQSSNEEICCRRDSIRQSDSEGSHHDEIASQLADSATSTAAHYRAVCRAKSRADFINKLSGAVEEVDESAFGSRFFARLRSVPAHSQCHCGRKPTNSPESWFGHAKQLVPRQRPPSARPRLVRRVKAGEAMAENHQSAITILQRITNQRSINHQCGRSVDPRGHSPLGGLLKRVRDFDQPRLAARAARERDAVGRRLGVESRRHSE